MGVGGEFGAGEEIDYVLNLLSLGFKGKYFGNDIIYHPAKNILNLKKSIKKIITMEEALERFAKRK